ncbi:MAG: RagB/SusD family nutrient uptake outer membrane protein [Chitinophagaceae bacterium]|nr:RagB/SusD family nutrient uptake outer membrane protein [Chitinophagaceae bacterium]
MKNIKTYHFLFIAVIISAMSCKKLTEKPISFVEPENFYTTPSQIEATFAGAMNRLWDYWGGYGYGMGNFVNDDQYDGGDLVIGNNHGSDLWSAHYAAILNLNSAIRAMNAGNLGASATPEELDVLMGQAKFIRAFNYFMLVRMFGDIPLITETTENPTTAEIVRSPIADVYALIVSDFTEAAAKLPRKWDAFPGRPTSGAAKGLLAKTYLTMATYPMNDPSNYAKAADYAGQVIQEGDYSLVHNIEDVFSVATKYGPEMMWSFNSNYADINTDPQIYRPGLLEGWGDSRVQIEWEQAIPETPRKNAYVLTELNGVKYPDWESDQTPFIKKFMYDSQDDYDNYSSIMSMPIIRFADVLLIYAEAANKANGAPTQDAVDAINLVIDRANGYAPIAEHPLLTTAMSVEDFDEAVIEERNQELCFEYDRWFDLIRKKDSNGESYLKLKTIPAFQPNYSDDDLLFPIPDADIELNDKMTQNPGYTN